MVRTLSAGSTTQSAHDHEIDAHRAHNAPRDACRGRPRPRPPQDQAVFSRTRLRREPDRLRTAHPDAPALLVSPASVSAPVPALVEDAAPTRTGSIATDEPAAPAACEHAARSGPGARHARARAAAATMTASQEASLNAWMIKTYLACWKPAAQPADADPYVARVRLKIQTRRIAPEAAEARQSAVRSGAEAAGKERFAGCQGMRPFADAGSISLLL